MVRFTIRELKSIARSPSTSIAQKRHIASYLKSEEGKERINRGKRMARKRRSSGMTVMGFRIPRY